MDTETTSFQIPKELKKKVGKYCKKQRIKPSQFYRERVYDFFDALDREREKDDST